jgi:Uncharacterized protein conserved in bacteria
MMRLADYLLRWTGDASYDDYWERNLYNGSLAQQHPETGMVTYFLPLRSGSVKKWGTPTDDFWCCQGTLIQAHTIYPNHIFYEEGNDLVLAQYIPCQLDWNKNGKSISLMLSEDTQPEAHRRPGSRSYELKITCPEPQEFALKFRLPWWISTSPEVMVNGEKQAIVGNPSTYALIHKFWQNDTVHITLPQTLTASPLPDLPDTVAFMEGPVVLAAVLGDRSNRTSIEVLTEKTLYGKKDDPASLLIPDNEREFTRWRSGYRTHGQGQNMRFISLYEIQDETYAVYFPIHE